MKLPIPKAFSTLLNCIARNALVPNDETIAAMQEARHGKLPSFKSVDALFADLYADD
jgi:DNA-damage-inducible protein J